MGESGEPAAVKSIIIPTPKCFPCVQDCYSVLSSSYCIIIFIVDCVYSRSDCPFALPVASSLSLSLSPLPPSHPLLSLSLHTFRGRPIACSSLPLLVAAFCLVPAGRLPCCDPQELHFSLRLDAVLYLLYQSIRLPDFPCLLCNPVSLGGRRCINYLSFNRAVRPLYNNFVRPTPRTALNRLRVGTRTFLHIVC